MNSMAVRPSSYRNPVLCNRSADPKCRKGTGRFGTTIFTTKLRIPVNVSEGLLAANMVANAFSRIENSPHLCARSGPSERRHDGTAVGRLCWCGQHPFQICLPPKNPRVHQKWMDYRQCATVRQVKPTRTHR